MFSIFLCWGSGRNLASITEGTNVYFYAYNKYGYRTSKTANGTTTDFNVAEDGTIVSQTDGTNSFFFEYSEDKTPLGFVLNGTQYIYITNNSGDVMAIADSSGNIIATYSYNEWGVPTVNATGDQNIAIANLNPLRYRGYYYDSETGYYYLQSRYYDPEICRFINADLPEYAKVQKNILIIGCNNYVYCYNSPMNYSDPNGQEAAVLLAATIIVAVLLFVGITFAVAFIASSTTFKPAINSVWSLLSDYGLSSKTIISILKTVIKQTYNYAKKIIDVEAKRASAAITVAAEDAKIKTKRNREKNKYTYWEVYRAKIYGYKFLIIGNGIAKYTGVMRLRATADVFCKNGRSAYDISKVAGYGKKPIGPEIDKGKENVIGFYWHYHLYSRNGTHAFFLK